MNARTLPRVNAGLSSCARPAVPRGSAKGDTETSWGAEPSERDRAGVPVWEGMDWRGSRSLVLFGFHRR